MKEPLTYRKAGVDVEAGRQTVDRIRTVLAEGPRKVPGGEEVGDLGRFAGWFRVFFKDFVDPLLVAATDGVGTKLLIALDHNRIEKIGSDLVAMNVNDLVVCGARPLFFLDYLATAKLDPDQVEIIIRSIQEACEEAECLLIGGECAEMPGMYAPGHTDLAGFAVGIVDADKVTDGSHVKPGDTILGISSSGLHSNGFSLVRKVIEREGWNWDEILPGCESTLLDTVLTPTKIYVKPLLALFDEFGAGKEGSIRACAHITGGGLLENGPRVIPDGCMARLKRGSWVEPPIFQLIKAAAAISDDEMDGTFNCGVGCMVIVAPENAEKARSLLIDNGEEVYIIGEVERRQPESLSIIIE